MELRAGFGWREHITAENPLSQGHFKMPICKLRCGWVGEDYALGLISPFQLGFCCPQAPVVGAEKGADLSAWQV